MRTRTVFGNCAYGALYLLLRGKGVRLILAPGGNWFLPWHLSVITRKGHCLNFHRLLNHKDNPWGGWWFVGSYKGIRRSLWRFVLSKRGRTHGMSRRAGMAWLMILFALFIVPWCLAALVYTPIWSIYWCVQALIRRIRTPNERKS